MSWETYLQTHHASHINELMDFLRIPSISGLAEHSPDVRQAGQWVASRLQSAGIQNVQLMETGGHPVVYGDWLHAPDKPTIIIYGHFDVQPVDPLELWTHPPFEPALEGDRIYARGATDDKGNMLIPILVAEAMLKADGGLPLNVKFLFEGQEEIGSPQLLDFLNAHKEMLTCDMVISADGGQWAKDQPNLILGLRGLCAVQIDVKTANQDLHSGNYGGLIHNPIQALAAILASLHHPDGKVAVEGFYDHVRPLTEDERHRFAAVPFEEAEYMEKLELPVLFGETGFTPAERIWSRPTLELNGIWGGFQEEGIKTVLPSEAHAKISCRLVPDQDPIEIIRLITEHVTRHTPGSVYAGTTDIASKAYPYRVPADHPGMLAAAEVLRKLYGKEPYYCGMGGSIPICGHLLKTLGVHTIDFAFGLKDEQIHAPNEFFRLSSFKKGMAAYGMLLKHLSANR